MEKTLNKRMIYAGKILNLRVDEVMLEDGKVAKREIVEHRGAVVIVPVLNDGRIVMVRQYRYAAGEEVLELPAGTLEEGESPINCARRELLEETGYKAEEIKELISFYSSPGFCDEKIHLFLARDLREGEQKLESDERVKVEVYSIEELREKIKTGNLKDAKSIAGILYYMCFCSDEESP